MAIYCYLLLNGLYGRYALLLKLSLMDARAACDAEASHKHALRRSRLHALLFLALLPLTMLGIALSVRSKPLQRSLSH